jgi:hypothetical protein
MLRNRKGNLFKRAEPIEMAYSNSSKVASPLVALPVSLRGDFDFIMAREGFDLREQSPGFRFKNWNRIIRSCKGSHGLQRVKEIHHDEFDFIGLFLSEDVSPSIAIDVPETREHLLSEHLLVGVCVLRRCPASPYTCNHPL